MTKRTKLKEASQKACAQCPWRLSNYGKPHPHGWYSKSNLRRLWTGLRNGVSMSCHPTDPDNEVPEGVKPPPDGITTLECAGALIIQQREWMKFQAVARTEKPPKGFPKYRSTYPGGMTLKGLRAFAERALFGGTFLSSGPALSKPDLNDKDVGYAPLAWNAEIAESCRLPEGESLS